MTDIQRVREELERLEEENFGNVQVYNEQGNIAAEFTNLNGGDGTISISEEDPNTVVVEIGDGLNSPAVKYQIQETNENGVGALQITRTVGDQQSISATVPNGQLQLSVDPTNMNNNAEARITVDNRDLDDFFESPGGWDI